MTAQLFQYAGVRSRSDRLSVEELKSQGFESEHICDRYETHLMTKEIPDEPLELLGSGRSGYRASPVRGRPDSVPLHPQTWRASFDFLVQPDSLLKIEEGKYDPKGPVGVAPDDAAYKAAKLRELRESA